MLLLAMTPVDDLNRNRNAERIVRNGTRRIQLHLRAGHLEEAMAISKKVAAILEAIAKQPRKRCKFDK